MGGRGMGRKGEESKGKAAWCQARTRHISKATVLPSLFLSSRQGGRDGDPAMLSRDLLPWPRAQQVRQVIPYGVTIKCYYKINHPAQPTDRDQLLYSRKIALRQRKKR